MLAHPASSSHDRRLATLALAALIVSSPAAPPASASAGLAVLSPGRAYVEADGESLYANVCQGCHMRDGRGATGAATYPSLAANADLRSTAFAVDIVVGGLKGMPPVGRSMTDDQVAAVLNYVRSHFGNTASDPVTAADVTAVRSQTND